MTPTERLLAAADKLDALAVVITPCLSYVEDGHVLPEDLAWFELMNHEAGKALAKVLRAEAKRLKRTELMRAFGGAPLFKPQPETLALADLLLAGE